MYRNTSQLIADLEKTKQLVRWEESVDPHLEAAVIARQMFAEGGPAVLFPNVKGSKFSMVANLFGTMERIHYIFRDSVEMVKKVMRLGVDPTDFMRRPGYYLDWKTPLAGWVSRPKRVSRGPILKNTCTLADLPQLQCWPQDGGAYLTLPQVYTEDPNAPELLRSNLGMYRVQISGGAYEKDQVGLHYQLHRGIGIHHARALERREKLRVNVFLGGPPALTLAAVMPLPEGMSELLFAGILNRGRIPMICHTGKLPISAEADFCLTGYIEPKLLKPEGPFGDHLGYYSLQHPFPVMRVEKVYHRDGAVFPFTVVGRPPQEDSMMGAFIHELVGDIVPRTLPGVKAVHAVDDCGVHPLLLAIGQERYTPYVNARRPMELLTLAHAILGTGQLSLAKYLFIVAGEDDPSLDVNDVPRFLRHLLERADWQNDLHFQTHTTVDTLDYSGEGLHRGSKLVVAAAGEKRYNLPMEVPRGMAHAKVVLPGVLVTTLEPWREDNFAIPRFCTSFPAVHGIHAFRWVVVVDDLDFATGNLRDFLWTLFTKTDPARDVYGIGSFTREKHWGATGPLVFDARRKGFHAPELEQQK